ncbi:COX15/CtaA family protein [Actinoplanes sp. NBRC 103695]|uniref:COX15/CtaA family protein n=1 Tax=Actinoplanes sp. NBRC 103695 TaxID=3032202 RepID=UPI00255480D3|nr:COX15/CtaA family protein [Actinoplanes sp. NBRC 103695]
MRLVTVRLPLRPLALASLITNALLVVTGGAVRLTGSGLGCPTWPKCTAASYTTTAEMGVHGAIEFGNRLLGVLLGLIALATFIAALLEHPRRRSQARLSFVLGLGVVAQGAVGGVTVLTGLNPWIVGAHFVISMVMTAGAYVLWQRTAEPDGPRVPLVPVPLRTLGRITTVVSAAVILVGVVVTGSGPHAGDETTPRNGFDPTNISQAHADLVFLLIGLSVALWFALRAVNAPPAAVRAAGVLVLVELGQGLIGFVQYFTHLPVLLVGAHMLGATLVWIATLAAVRSLAAPAAAPVAPAARPVPATTSA